MSDPDVKSLLPVNHLLQIPQGETPYLEGLCCEQCGNIFTDKRLACAACYARGSLKVKRLASTGKVLAFTVVRRSFPGIAVPYISAVVELEGGGDIKVNIINQDPDAPELKVGLDVALTFDKAPWGDEHGNDYMIYAVQPLAHTEKEIMS